MLSPTPHRVLRLPCAHSVWGRKRNSRSRMLDDLYGAAPAGTRLRSAFARRSGGWCGRSAGNRGTKQRVKMAKRTTPDIPHQTEPGDLWLLATERNGESFLY